jgi:hypothetical protein
MGEENYGDPAETSGGNRSVEEFFDLEDLKLPLELPSIFESFLRLFFDLFL